MEEEKEGLEATSSSNSVPKRVLLLRKNKKCLPAWERKRAGQVNQSAQISLDPKLLLEDALFALKIEGKKKRDSPTFLINGRKTFGDHYILRRNLGQKSTFRE